MDTPFTPKTHISKRIKLWAIILLVAVILASGLAMLTGGKTRLFKGFLGGHEEQTSEEKVSLINSSIAKANELLDANIVNNISNLISDIESVITKIEVNEWIEETPEEEIKTVTDEKNTYAKLVNDASKQIQDAQTLLDQTPLITAIAIHPIVEKITEDTVSGILEETNSLDILETKTKEMITAIEKWILDKQPIVVKTTNKTAEEIADKVINGGTGKFLDVSDWQSLIETEIEKTYFTITTKPALQEKITTISNTIKEANLLLVEADKLLQEATDVLAKTALQSEPLLVELIANDNSLKQAFSGGEKGNVLKIKFKAGKEAIKIYTMSLDIYFDWFKNTLPIESLKLKKSDGTELKATIEFLEAGNSYYITMSGNDAWSILSNTEETLTVEIITTDVKTSQEFELALKQLNYNSGPVFGDSPTTMSVNIKSNKINVTPKSKDEQNGQQEETTIFQITCEHTKNATWTQGSCAFNGGMYGNIDEFNTAIANATGQPQPQPGETTDGDQQTPTLNVSLANDTPAGKEVKPSDTVEVAKFLLAAKNSDIKLTNLLLIAANSNSKPSQDIENIYVIVKEQNKPDYTLIAQPINDPPSSYTIAIDQLIQKGKSINISIQTKIKQNAIEKNTFRLGFFNGLFITTNNEIDPVIVQLTSSPLLGNEFTIGSIGNADTVPTLNVTLSSDTPAGKEIKPGETNIEVAKFDLQATNQDLNIQKLNISAVDENNQLLSPQDIKSITVWLESAPAKKTTIDLPGPSAATSINIQPSFLILQNTPQKLVIEVNTNTTAVNGHKFKVGFVDANGVIVEGGNPVTINQLKGNLFTIAVADPTKTPAGAQLTVSKPIPEIGAGTITVGSSTDVLKLKFQATDSDITVNSIKITTQGSSAPVTDLQFFKLMEGVNVIGSSSDIGVSTLIATPSFTISKGFSRELTLNVTAKSTAVKDNAYLFKIAVNTDISALPQNVFLEPGNELLSSQAFTIATAGAGAGTGTSSTPVAPTVSVTASPSNTQVVNQNITFTMTINNPLSGGLYTYYLDLGDGKTIKSLPTSASTIAIFDHSYNETKSYSVKGTVIVNNTNTSISAPDLNYTITSVAPPPPPPGPSQDIVNLQNQMALLQQQLANAQSSQSSQSTAQIQALTQQIAQLAALAAAKQDETQSKSDKEPAKKPKTPIETVEMWGAGQSLTPAPAPSAPVYIPPFATQPAAPAYLAQVPTGAPMYAAAPSLGYSQKLVKAPEKSNTGPEVLVYFIAVGAANAAWWVRRKIRK